jgi:hypothetical protein
MARLDRAIHVNSTANRAKADGVARITMDRPVKPGENGNND